MFGKRWICLPRNDNLFAHLQSSKSNKSFDCWRRRWRCGTRSTETSFGQRNCSGSFLIFFQNISWWESKTLFLNCVFYKIYYLNYQIFELCFLFCMYLSVCAKIVFYCLWIDYNSEKNLNSNFFRHIITWLNFLSWADFRVKNLESQKTVFLLEVIRINSSGHRHLSPPGWSKFDIIVTLFDHFYFYQKSAFCM